MSTTCCYCSCYCSNVAYPNLASLLLYFTTPEPDTLWSCCFVLLLRLLLVLLLLEFQLPLPAPVSHVVINVCFYCFCFTSGQLAHQPSIRQSSLLPAACYCCSCSRPPELRLVLLLLLLLIAPAPVPQPARQTDRHSMLSAVSWCNMLLIFHSIIYMYGVYNCIVNVCFFCCFI